MILRFYSDTNAALAKQTLAGHGIEVRDIGVGAYEVPDDADPDLLRDTAREYGGDLDDSAEGP